MTFKKWLGVAVAGLTLSAVGAAQDKPKDAPKPAEAKPADAKPAQDAKGGEKPAAGGDDAAMMAEMMKYIQPGENHKLLMHQVGDWTYKVKHWMDPSAPPAESTGTSTAKAIMGGRYVVAEHKGKFSFPGPDGKMVDQDFHGMGITGYDNVQQKFVNSWIDNMGTGFMNMTGTYDAAKKTFSFKGEVEMMPKMKSTMHEVIKVIDNDNFVFEMHEQRGPDLVKVMEITYARKK